MALWDKISSRGNVDDRRGRPGLIGGGLGITGIVIVLLFNVLTGGDVGTTLEQLSNEQVQTTSTYNTEDFEGADSYELFASQVLGSANDMWSRFFAANSLSYQEPTLVLFRNATESACGTADSRIGPHYCPLDETIYIDETFFDELTERFGAEGGDVAEAYVIAHEMGHHIQNLLGTLDDVETQADAINLELQADCFAGLWAYSLKDLGIFEPEEIHEAMDAAAAVGDDRIQTATEGRVSPESWTHGSSEQRTAALNTGYESGSPASCDY